MKKFFESEVEEAALEWLEGIGYQIAFGPDIAHDGEHPERTSYSDVLLRNRCLAMIQKLNPSLDGWALLEVMRKITSTHFPSIIDTNQAIHKLFVEGIAVEAQKEDGSFQSELVKLFDFDHPENNDWLAVNQFTIIEDSDKRQERRPDIVVFVNGLPLAVIELKNPADEAATIWTAFQQIQTYKAQISTLFRTNELCIISDGLEARVGSLTADRERYLPWRTIEGEDLAPSIMPKLEVLIKGLFAKKHLLDYIQHFVVFEDEGGKKLKKIAGYHQFHAVRSAVESVIEASSAKGDHRGGVIWHTQGSGKSLTMTFFAGKIIVHPKMENPTLVVLTDRNDLDDQLFGVFSRCHDLLRQTPQQAKDRADLKKLLKVASGGVVFTTIQKFLPEGNNPFDQLSDRSNIIVMADEAHRSQYDFIDGYARHMREALPNATYIGFTGTPIESADRDTRAVFGDYVSVYDIQRAVEDGATVPIYYESRLAKLELDPELKKFLDTQFEEVTEGEESDRKEKLKTKWAALEAIVGSDKRIKLIAKDIVDHFEKRVEIMDGKAMIVCMSRRICIDLYNEIVKLRPNWGTDDDKTGIAKVVMTGSASDQADWQPHIRNKKAREELAKRFKDAKDSFKIAIVRDMWLTGFDAPCMHTMYIDKPMRGHGLMQAIARVNRVFKDKPGGLVVDYLGLAYQLKKALAAYTESGGKGQATIDKDEAVTLMMEKYEVCRGLFHGFDWSAWTGSASARLSLLPSAQEHILKQQDGAKRLATAVGDLTKAFALAVPHPQTVEIRDDVAFFQTVKAALTKASEVDKRPFEEVEHAIHQIVSKAVASNEVMDIFAVAGLKKPDISILSDEFLAEVKGMEQKNLAVEVLKKLLLGEIKSKFKTNVVRQRSFADLLEKAIKAYQNRAIETVQVLDELIGLAKDIREVEEQDKALGLNQDEIAFYDAIATVDDVETMMGVDTLRQLARELVETVKKNTNIDWQVRESVRAALRVAVKRLLRKYGYPPTYEKTAVDTVIEQAERMAGEM
jgi:type I restriction enzyme R subunit